MSLWKSESGHRGLDLGKLGAPGVIVNPELLGWGPRQQVFLDLHSEAAAAGECNPATRCLGERCQLASGFLSAAAAAVLLSLHLLQTSRLCCTPLPSLSLCGPCSFSSCSSLCCSFNISLFRFERDSLQPRDPGHVIPLSTPRQVAAAGRHVEQDLVAQVCFLPPELWAWKPL